MGARIAVFRRAHMRNYDDIHTKSCPGYDKAPELGYPDCGSGWYSRDLPYEEWFKLNCGQRCQINFLEQLPIVLVSCLVSGISYPKWTFGLCVVYCIARMMYNIGYMSHPKRRVPGALL